MRATAASSSIGARCWLDLCHPVGIDNLRVQLGMSAFGAKRTFEDPLIGLLNACARLLAGAGHQRRAQDRHQAI